MSILTALLTQDQVVSPRQIDEAIERQVLTGGDLETCLLELGVLPEDTLTAYCAALHNLPPAPRASLLEVDPRAVAMVPRASAEAWGVVPLRVEKNKLVCVAQGAVPTATVRALEGASGLPVELRVVTPFRLAWALSQRYGVALSSRFARLASRLESVAPGAMPTVSRPPGSLGPGSSSPGPTRATTSALATLAALLDDGDDDAPEAPAAVVVPHGVQVTNAPPAPSPSPSPSPVEAPRPASTSLAEAQAALAQAATRDQAVRALFGYTRGVFAYAALFVFHGEACEGLAADGEGAPTEVVRGIAVPLEATSVFRTVRERGVHLLADVREGTDAIVREDLLRKGVSQALVVPIRVGSRSALALWVDAGALALDSARVDPLLRLTEDAAAAFTRLVLSRKQGPSGARSKAADALSGAARRFASMAPRRDPSDRPKTPSVQARREALRRALVTSALESLPAPPATRPSARPPSAPPEGVSDLEHLVQDIAQRGAIPEGATAALLARGEAALAALFRHFPGPHGADRGTGASRLPEVAETGPILRLVALFRHSAVPHLLKALESPSVEARFCALLCLGEIVHPEALPRLVRALFDADARVRQGAVKVLRQYRHFVEFREVAEGLRALARDPQRDPERRRVAIGALGELRDADAVPTLVGLLEDPDDAVALSAHRALVVLARQDFARNVPRWAQWWDEARGRHRIEWLIDALLHPDGSVRHEAGEELKRVSGQLFGYYFNLPKREREKAHQRYQEWWLREGAALFASQRWV